MKFLKYGLMLLAISGSLLAQEIVVEKIEFQGLQRVSIGSALNSASVEPGDRLDQEAQSTIIRRLFESGYFQDIKLRYDAEIKLLLIEVIEQPSIAELTFDGNKKITNEILTQAFSDARIQEGEVFNRSGLSQLTGELERQYQSMGRYNAKVTTEVTALPRNRVNIEVQIDEGDEAKIASISIVGNKTFSDTDLLREMSLKRTGSTLFQFFTKKNRYQTEKARADQQALASWYLDRGYLKYELLSTQVAISPDREKVHLTYNIREGEPYIISSVQLGGDLVNDDENLQKLLTLESGELFSRHQASVVQGKIQRRLSDLGYAFANVSVVTERDDQNKKVDLIYQIDPGKRTYIRQINISGNKTTDDEVIRREFQQLEGALASGDKINTSRSRLQRTGFFSGVQLNTQRVSGTDDQLDLNVEVTEVKDGTLTGSVGWADPGGLFVSVEFQQRNFRGSGKDVLLKATNNEYETVFNLEYKNPYFTLDGVSLSYDLSYKETDFSDISENDFGTNTWGGGFRFGYPLSNDQRVSYGLNYTFTELFINEPAQEVSQFVADYGQEFHNYGVNLNWSFNSLNGTFLASRGQSHSLNLEASLPTSDLEFYKIRYNGKYYWELNDSYSLRFRTGLGYGEGFGDSDQLPFFEHFYAGGVNTVRGYYYGTLGPLNTPAVSSSDEPSPFGGNVLVTYGLDLYFPMPVARDKTQFRPSIFLDAGNVFTTKCLPANTNCDEGVNWDEIRYSWGVEVDWMTPLAPLRFIWGNALNAREGDTLQNFTFTFGYSF